MNKDDINSLLNHNKRKINLMSVYYEELVKEKEKFISGLILNLIEEKLNKTDSSIKRLMTENNLITSLLNAGV